MNVVPFLVANSMSYFGKQKYVSSFLIASSMGPISCTNSKSNDYKTKIMLKNITKNYKKQKRYLFITIR
jgi:hypothetical protein